MRNLPESLQSLRDLAFDLRWLSSQRGQALARAIDERAWERTHDVWAVVRDISQDRLNALGGSPEFSALLARSVQEQSELLSRAAWFDAAYPSGIGGSVAYFSMEFAAAEGLPIYAGGLGVLAGDHLKAASDLGVPIAGVGLLYQRGYFRQAIDARGEQRETFPYNDPQTLPVTPVLTGAGEPLSIALEFPGRTVNVRVWHARIGRVPLYLLDTNDPRNDPADRAITAELYGGDAQTRLQQEIVLGIGGWRALEEIGISPAVCHLNEGHAAFAVLERARRYAARTGAPFLSALEWTRAATLFTTHTAVAAGFDQFAPELLLEYFTGYVRGAGITPQQLLALGRAPRAKSDAPFNMAYLATRGASAVNAVSALHEQVSRPIFQPVFDGLPLKAIPLSHVTNGVHVPSWSALGLDESHDFDSQIAALSDEQLWRTRVERRAALAARFGLRPDALTVCLSRRFTEYKRVTLLLSDPQRLVRLLADSDRPVQLLVAGKAHPRDTEGRAAIRRWVEFTKRPDVAGRALFVADYDLAIASAFTQGADVWLNTPRRPWEACGTSGMKAVLNGALNLSTLDGWWDEAYTPQVGWALGTRDDRARSDEADAQQLYALLEREIVPAFYDRDERGVPRAWVAKMRASLSQLGPRFSASRMVREYVDRYYARLARELHAASGDGRLTQADTTVV